MDTATSFPRLPRRELWAVGGAVLLFCLIAVTIAMPAEEDAFIYYRYAWNAVHGVGLVFNAGDPVEGFSGPLWMGILALLARVGLDLPMAAPALGIVCGAATLMATWWLGRVVGLDRFGRLAAVGTLAVSYPFVLWARSGLETPLYSLALVVTAAAYLAAEVPLQEDPRTRRWCRWVAAVAPLFVCLGRPEGAVLVAVMVVDRLTDRRDVAGAIRYAAPAVIGYGSYLVWRFHTFHSLVPNTSVKLYPLLIDRSAGQFLGYVLFLGVLPPLLPVLALFARRAARPERRRVAFLLAGVGLVSVFFNFLAGGDYRLGFRYFVPTLPLLVVAIWYSCELLLGGRSSARAARAARAALLALLLGGPLLMLWRNPPRLADWRRQVYEPWRDPFADTTHWGVDIARWIESHVPAGSVVAFGQMGRVPYYQSIHGHEIVFIDTLGLIDRQVARIYRFDGKLADFARAMRAGRSPREALELGRRQRAGQLAATVLARHPDFILIETALDDYSMMKALVGSPAFRADYRQTGQLPPDAPPYVRIYSRRPDSIGP